MLKIVILTVVATLSAAIGQILMRKGMQIIGPLESYAPMELLSYFWRALTQPYVIAGTVGSAVFYFAILATLSWGDVSVAIPLTAMEYVFVAVFAIILLKEPVPPARWIGIILVIIGVTVISITGGDEEVQQAGGAKPAAVKHQIKIQGDTQIEAR